MPSKNSYNKYATFVDSLEKAGFGFSEEEQRIICRFMGQVMEKSPSAQMGGDDFTDHFMCKVSRQPLKLGNKAKKDGRFEEELIEWRGSYRESILVPCPVNH